MSMRNETKDQGDRGHLRVYQHVYTIIGIEMVAAKNGCPVPAHCSEGVAVLMANSMLYACTTKLVERRKTMAVDGYRLPERTCRLYPDLRCIAMSSAMAFLS